jgi:hypothetical protein
MRTQSIYTLLTLAAITLTFGSNDASGAVSLQVGTPNLSFSINDYQPAPPNVYIHNDQGRPYYVERDRRVYMEKKKSHNHKKEQKHHDNNGHRDGHNR